MATKTKSEPIRRRQSLTAYEQKVLEVVLKFQEMGVVPRKPWDTVDYLNYEEVTGIRVRTVLFNWRPDHVLEVSVEKRRQGWELTYAVLTCFCASAKKWSVTNSLRLTFDPFSERPSSESWFWRWFNREPGYYHGNC